MKHTKKNKLAEFTPLILILVGISIATALAQFYIGEVSIQNSMRFFMGFFFISFGFFKTLDLKGFVMAYAEYDIIAAKSKAYATVYPLIELVLGGLYLANLYQLQTNIATVIVMSISSIGVTQAVTNKRKIKCACLGTVVKLPMTTVTIIEDVGMGLMALLMLMMMF